MKYVIVFELNIRPHQLLWENTTRRKERETQLFTSLNNENLIKSHYYSLNIISINFIELHLLEVY